MQKVIIFYFLSGWLVEGLIADPAEGFLEVVLRMIMAFSTLAIFLVITKKWSFFNPLFTSIFVCENFIMTLATAVEGLDVYMVMTHVVYREEIAIGLGIFLVVWYLLIVAYILRQFFTFALRESIILATSYFVLTYGIPMFFMDV
ncbi:MAG: hypothetical protein Q9M50_14395 [Methylococcales bacterium]|nr:hypothetical protein [Methylococcales bacterium]